MAEDAWLMQVGDGLSAHFKQEGGPSRPGVLWAVKLKRGASMHTALVKVLFADDAPAEITSNSQFQAKAALHYLSERLAAGWHPSEEAEHRLILGASGPASTSKAKAWWRFW